MAKDQAAAENARQSGLASGLNFSPKEIKRVKPDESQAEAKTKAPKDENDAPKKKEMSGKDNLRKGYAMTLKPVNTSCKKTFYIRQDIAEKAEEAKKKGEIKSLNGLINYLLEAYFNEKA